MKANNMKRFLLALLFVPVTVFASGAALHLDRAPNVQDDPAALQNGAKLFVNYCLNCHGLSFVRYNRLTELGLTDQQVRDNLGADAYCRTPGRAKEVVWRDAAGPVARCPGTRVG